MSRTLHRCVRGTAGEQMASRLRLSASGLSASELIVQHEASGRHRSPVARRRKPEAASYVIPSFHSK